MPLSPYPDHLFGDLDQPPKGGLYQREHVTGVHHHAAKSPIQLLPGQPLTLSASTSSDLPVQGMWLSLSTDDWATQSDLPFSPTGLSWDTPAWLWLRSWELHLPPQPAGALLRYRVWAELADGTRRYAETQSATPQGATPYALWADPRPTPPAWAEQARLYQVFVDRFNPGRGQTWRQQDDLLSPFGGTLRGVTEKLDHIQSLGCDAIWLTPIFRSPSHHGYDASDYTHVEERLGSAEDLEQLITQAHQRGMRLILDFAANHCSDQHPAFQAALKDRHSRHAAGFKWKNWPDYVAYYGLANMPELDLSFGSPAHAHLLAAAQQWLKMGVDGFRLDYAPGPGQAFWTDFRRACRAVNPDCWLFGEAVSPADAQLALAGTMDGTLDFLTCQALRETFATGHWPLSRLAAYLETNRQYFPAEFSRPAFIDNHDMNRFLFTAQGRQSALKSALTLLYLLPGQPILYYGTESGLSQRRSIHDHGSAGFDEARLAMNWAEAENHPTARLIRQLAAMRAASPWLTRAVWHTQGLDDRQGRLELCLSNPAEPTQRMGVQIHMKAGEVQVEAG